MASKKSNKRRREAAATGVKPFEDAEDVNEDNDDNNDDADGEDKTVATNKAKKRQAEEDAVEDEVTDEADDDDEEDDDEDEEDVDVGFAPFIIHEDMEWDLVSVVDESDVGETLFFYRAPTEDSPTARWYKLEVIEVGEVPAAKK